MILPKTVDAIFVFAGRESRKRFGLELYRKGRAEALVLSVGRFEWRRFEKLGLSSDGGLVDLVQTIPPPERHFFVWVDSSGARARAIRRGRLGTWSEARALAALVEREGLDSVLLVSDRAHLRRCRLAASAHLPPRCRVRTEPSPEGLDQPKASRLVEAFKLLFYALGALFFRVTREVRRTACTDRQFLL